MSKYLKTLQAGFTIRAGKFISDLLAGIVPVVPADEVERFLEKNNCTPIGDTADKVLKDMVANGYSEEIMARARKLYQVG
jgi:hypothetical protein